MATVPRRQRYYEGATTSCSACPSATPNDPSHLAPMRCFRYCPQAQHTKGVVGLHDFEAYRAASPPAVYASRQPLPAAVQDSLPAGGLRLCRAGVEPAGSRRKVSVHVIPLSRAYPVASWAHGRRKFYELADIAAGKRRGKSAPPISPLALEAVTRIDAIFDIERAINGETAARRLAVRREQSAPLVAELKEWMRTERAGLSRHADVAKAMDYMLKRWDGFARFLDDGRICLTNNAAERALRGIALGRKSWLFAGSDRGGERAAAMYTLIGTAKLNDVDPQAWLADVLDRIADMPQSRLPELLPWHWKAEREQDLAAPAGCLRSDLTFHAYASPGEGRASWIHGLRPPGARHASPVSRSSTFTRMRWMSRLPVAVLCSAGTTLWSSTSSPGSWLRCATTL